MEEDLKAILQFIETSYWYAPLLFILLHIIRPFLFIPVLVTCFIGGYLFGSVYGSIYSIIGLTLTSIIFYFIISKSPRLAKKLSQVKNKVMKQDKELTDFQLILIRLVPFIHFHLVSFYLYETTKSFKQFVPRSFLLVIPTAVIYTSFGDVIHQLPLNGTIALTLFLIFIFFISRKKEETIAWRDFIKLNS